MAKFLNSEQAKAEEAEETQKSLEERHAEVQLENQQLRARNEALADTLAQYALQIASLQVELNEAKKKDAYRARMAEHGPDQRPNAAGPGN